MTTRIEDSLTSRELKGVELFLFMYNFLFERVFYKGISKIPFLFEIYLRLHQVQMIGELVFHVIHIAGTQMI